MGASRASSIRYRVGMIGRIVPLIIAAAFALGASGCPFSPGITSPGNYANTTDPTNGGASYIGSKACSACHPSYAEMHANHGHAHILTKTNGAAPTFPPIATRAGVPDPPFGYAWSNIAYVIGGYTKAARFIGIDGYILTTGATSRDTQWLLDNPAIGVAEGFVAYEPTNPDPLPYDYSCFKCHTTGAAAQSPSNPQFQDGRPGILGTWQEEAVRCEACHGPGSNHVPNPFARANFVDLTGAQSCGNCHGKPEGADRGDILVRDGFIEHNQQWVELRASGGHAGFQCGYCHDSHRSTVYDRANALRNECLDCHADMNMALHKGKVFTRGDYSEPLTCESCHMPFAALTAAPAPVSAVGSLAHVGDTRSHVFRISPIQADFNAVLSDDKTKLKLDDQGRAALSADFVCLRCHNSVSLPTLAFTPARAGEIAMNVHADTPLNQKRIRALLNHP